jgi:glycosyltransferase involved in cell wall biosynthesis
MILVTMPAYNEEGTIAGVILGIHEALKGEDYKIMVVDDGSTDDTAVRAYRAGALVYSKPHYGLAETFRNEMVIARTIAPDYIVHLDADGQYEPRAIPYLLATAKKFDLVLGNRLWQHPQGMPQSKYISNKVGAWLYSKVLGGYLPDVTTGYRAFNLKVAALPIRANYTYTQEQVYRTAKAGLSIASFPVNFAPRGDKSRLMSGAFHYLTRSVVDFRAFGGVR